MDINMIELKESPYDYVACHYYEMSKEQIKDIALEAIYQLNSEQEENMIEELEDRWDV